MRRLPDAAVGHSTGLKVPLASVLGALLLGAGAASPLEGQWVTFTPSGGSYTVGTVLGVTIKFCDNPPQYYLSHSMTFNGQDVTGNFGGGGGDPDPNCTFLMYWYGTVTLASGQNTLQASFTDYYFDGADQYWESGGSGTANFTGTAGPPPVVTAEGGVFVQAATGVTTTFRVTASQSGTHAMSLSCTGVASGCAATPSSVYIAQGNQADVGVTYNVSGAPMATGQVTLSATNGTTGQASLAVQVAPNDPVIAREQCLTIAVGPSAAYECGDLRIVHPLPSVRTLNTVRTPTLLYNSAHAHPYALFSADVTIASWEPQPSSVWATIRINGQIVNQDEWFGTQWPAGQTTTRRIPVGFNASGYGTGLYAYQLELGRTVNGQYSAIRTDTGSVAIVNRINSPFGVGWWLAGFEQLQFTQAGGGGAILWIGGDGSVRRYVPAGGNVYVATPVDGPDSLLYNGTTYTRKLKGGGSVAFNSQGHHIRTTNRLGYSTEFTVDVGSGRLTAITVPPTMSGLVYAFIYAGQAGTLSRVDAPDTVLPTIDHRYTYIGTSGARIQSITDPGTTASVQFTFHDYYTNLISWRTDRRGGSTWFGYGAYLKLYVASQSISGAINPVRTFCPAETRGASSCAPNLPVPDSAYTRYDAPRQNAPTDSTDITDFWLDRFGGVLQVRDPYQAITTVTRGDPRWPALATQVQSPTGDSRWPIVVTRATYDQRGNLASTTAVNPLNTGVDAITRYEWDLKWDAVTSIVTPTGVTTRMAYDASNGNRLWIEDGRGSPSRTTFSYVTSGYGIGLVRLVTPPSVPHQDYYGTTIQYNNLGNTFTVSPPAPTVPSVVYYEDRLGRRINAVTPAGGVGVYRQDSTFYDARDRIIRTVAHGPAMNGASVQTLNVRNFYNEEGQLDSLWRWSSPDPAGIGTIRTRWVYDAAGRMITEIAPDGRQEVRRYDPAGNVTSDSTRRGHVITMAYDRMNRLVSRSLPAVNYPSRPTSFTISSPTPVLPFPAYSIPAETHTFSYYAGGRLRTVLNADAQVGRSYFPNGQLETDTLRIQTVNRDSWTSHAYVNRHAYDLDGRRITLTIPAQLAAGGATTVAYAYDPSTGSLQSVTDLQGSQYVFRYNWQGDLDSIGYPSGYSQTFDYDLRGRLAADTIRNTGGTASPRIPSTLVRATRFSYDDGDRVVWSGDPLRFQDTLRVQYSGLGMVVSSQLSQHGQFVGVGPFGVYNTSTRFAMGETYTNDALGNRTVGAIGDTVNCCSTGWMNTSSTYTPSTGRLAGSTIGGVTTSHAYDRAGNLDSMTNLGTPAMERASYFAADGTLRAVDLRWAVSHYATALGAQRYTIEDYRYDALGRRVWARAQRTCNDVGMDLTSATACRTSLLRRTVWDGDQELAEIQMPWGFQTGGPRTIGTVPSSWENDTAPVSLGTMYTNQGTADANPYFGRVIYAGRQGIDQPVAITRVDYVTALDLISRQPSSLVKPPFTIVPFWNARGDAPGGVFSNGAQLLCNPPTSQTACVGIVWSWNFSAFDRQRTLVRDNWHGTLLEDKRDGSGFYYRRNRYYDAASGRFTQEDPIGLAGGLNLYGFAGGDPVNFSDPFGLCPLCIAAGVVVGAGVGIIEGFTVAKLVGADYTVTDAVVDGTLGVVAAGVALLGATRYVARARGAQRAVDAGGSVSARAAQSAGRHSGFVANYAGRSVAEIQRAVRSLERVAVQHEDKLRNPTAYITDFYQRSAAE